MRNHYIPKAYLSGFTNNNDKIWVYDMLLGKQYCTNRINAGVENNLYGDDTEVLLAKEIEDKNQETIEKLRNRRFITIAEKQAFCSYIGNMLMRVPENKKLIAKLLPEVMNSVLRDFAMKLTSETGQNLAQLQSLIEQTRLNLDSRDQNTLLFEYMVQPKRLNQFIAFLNQMKWQCLISNKLNFITSDNPVFFPKELGIGNSELIFPLSTDVVLWVNSGTHIKEQFVKVDQKVVDTVNQKIVDSANRFVYFSSNAKWLNELIFTRRANQPK